MSSTPEINLLDLDRHFLPAWAQESSSVNRYSQYSGDDGGRPDRGNRPRRDGGGGPGRRPGGPGPGRDRMDRGPRPPRPQGQSGPGSEAGRPGGRGPGSFQGQGQGQGRGPGGPGRRPGPGGPRGGHRRDEPAPSFPEVRLNIVPDEKLVESLVRQMRLGGRAYPIFEIGSLVLKQPDRYHLLFEVVKKQDGTVVQGLWGTNLDEQVFLSEADAVGHVLARHFDTFYQTEKLPSDPPKGIYTFVAQCGISGVILGPPNYHDYQNKLRKLHSERFSRMPFDMFKSRVRIVKDEAVVKKWVEEQSFRFEYVCLNVQEAKKLANREEVTAHFREVHLPTIVRQVDRLQLAEAKMRDVLPGPLQAMVRWTLEEQRRFPMKVVNTLSQQFASRGLQFYKFPRTSAPDQKNVTYVAVARPRYLDLETTSVSDSVRKIVEFVTQHPGTSRRQLIEALAPTPAVVPVPAPVAAPAEPPVVAAPVEGAEVAAAAPAPVAAAPAGPTPDQEVVIRDLHWLVHEGHVVEFATGELEAARKPLPRPVKAPAPAATPVAPPAAVEGVVAAEVPAAPAVEVVAPAVEASQVPPVPAAVETVPVSGAPAVSGDSTVVPGV